MVHPNVSCSKSPSIIIYTINEPVAFSSFYSTQLKTFRQKLIKLAIMTELANRWLQKVISISIHIYRARAVGSKMKQSDVAQRKMSFTAWWTSSLFRTKINSLHFSRMHQGRGTACRYFNRAGFFKSRLVDGVVMGWDDTKRCIPRYTNFFLHCSTWMDGQGRHSRWGSPWTPRSSWSPWSVSGTCSDASPTLRCRGSPETPPSCGAPAASWIYNHKNNAFFNKPGTAKVGAISKAQLAQSF